MQLLRVERMILRRGIYRDLVSVKEVPNTTPQVPSPPPNHLLNPWSILTVGTDFSSVRDTDWEKVRLQRELATLNEKIESAEAEARSRRLGKSNTSSKSALVKRELEQMLDFKRRELRRLKDGED